MLKLKTVLIGSLTAIVGLVAVFVGAASATGYLKRSAPLQLVVSPVVDIAGDCVVQSRWVTSGGKRIQIERPVCY
ncbi:MAG TPA: hypothetical protein VLA00_16945 [Xanthobacteraceae bacterium]|nr:hypothetical protein [Xanthobacteraceae bacterium]